MSELTPYLCVPDSRAAIDWYREYLGAEVTAPPIVMDDGRVGHCEVAREGARWMMSDPFDEVGVAPPDDRRGNPVTLHLTVDDVDVLCRRVEQGGARIDREPADTPPIGRLAVFHDPFGHRWFLNQPLPDPD